MEEAPSAIYRKCPRCHEEVLQQVVKGRVGSGKDITFDGTLRCSACRSTYHSTFKVPGERKVPVIVSWMGESRKTTITSPKEEVIEIGEVRLVDGTQVLITSIETEGKRVNAAKAGEIDTIWSKRYEQVKVKFSINKRGRTISRYMMAVPEEEFTIGEIINFGRLKCVIHNIKVAQKVVRSGSVQASEIVRVYCKSMR